MGAPNLIHPPVFQPHGVNCLAVHLARRHGCKAPTAAAHEFQTRSAPPLVEQAQVNPATRDALAQSFALGVKFAARRNNRGPKQKQFAAPGASKLGLWQRPFDILQGQPPPQRGPELYWQRTAIISANVTFHLVPDGSSPAPFLQILPGYFDRKSCCKNIDANHGPYVP